MTQESQVVDNPLPHMLYPDADPAETVSCVRKIFFSSLFSFFSPSSWLRKVQKTMAANISDTKAVKAMKVGGVPVAPTAEASQGSMTKSETDQDFQEKVGITEKDASLSKPELKAREQEVRHAHEPRESVKHQVPRQHHMKTRAANKQLPPQSGQIN